jgi:hypothetical protein
MKRNIALIALFIGLSLYAQNKPAASGVKQDWDLLDETFITLIQALEKGNEASFKSVSLANLDCVDCVGPTEYSQGGVFVPSGFFFAVISKNFTASPVYKALSKKGYSFSSVTVKNFRPPILPKTFPKDTKFYEVWVETYKPGELSKNHTGTSHSFRFVKVNGKFKFYGLTSIP